ncbi:hypothetical protein MKX01_021322 [Papaver californicum]|nr:hypothetical protein MKX01_021322 [Papaver californicum]
MDFELATLKLMSGQLKDVLASKSGMTFGEIQLSNEFLLRESPLIRVHKMVDLSGSPDRGSMWYLEVNEAYKLFYDFSFEE